MGASRFSSRPLRPMVTTCGCSTNRRWSTPSPRLRSAASWRWISSAAAYGIAPKSRTTQVRAGISGIDGEAVHVIEGFADRFVEGGMRVDGVHHGIDRGLRFHGRDRFGNQFVSLGADDVDAQNLAVLLIGYNLNEAVVRAENSGFAVGCKGELAYPDFVSGGFSLCFGQTDASNARLGVGCTGDAIAIDRGGGLT